MRIILKYSVSRSINFADFALGALSFGSKPTRIGRPRDENRMKTTARLDEPRGRGR